MPLTMRRGRIRRITGILPRVLFHLTKSNRFTLNREHKLNRLQHKVLRVSERCSLIRGPKTQRPAVVRDRQQQCAILSRDAKGGGKSASGSGGWRRSDGRRATTTPARCATRLTVPNCRKITLAIVSYLCYVPAARQQWPSPWITKYAAEHRYHAGYYAALSAH
jgi:hypothetical protein